MPIRFDVKKSALFACAAAVLSTTAFADEPIPFAQGSALLAKYKCDACHQAYTSAHGPSLHAIAGKYSASPTARTELETMVLNGSSGVWGADSAMAPNDVPDADLHPLVAWILSLRGP